MFSSTITLIILSIFIGTAAWLVFSRAVKKGQFDDIEGPKYRMLEDDPELPDDTVDRKKDDD